MSKEPDHIGRYAVTSELGRGSMGVVHLAHDPLMDRDLAIKTILLPCGLPEDREVEFRARFLREAQAAGRLSHPGIVTIYDFNGEPGGEPPFIAMEYVQGPTLHELICDEGALRPEWALNMAETLADALRVAHESGVLHRDIKPANILVRETDGVAKIADFGVARVRASDRQGSDYTYGSPAYMAPECVRGEPSDELSDLFSLAVIFYETLSGHRPFEGDGYDAIRNAILNDTPPPIRRYCPDLTPAFETFFHRALAKNPDDRYAGASEFCAALQAIRDEQFAFGSGARTVITPIRPEARERQESPQTTGARSRRWMWLAGVPVLVVVAFALGRGVRVPQPAEPTPPRQPVPASASHSQPSSAVPLESIVPTPEPTSDPAETIPGETLETLPATASAPAESEPPAAPAPRPAAPATKRPAAAATKPATTTKPVVRPRPAAAPVEPPPPATVEALPETVEPAAEPQAVVPPAPAMALLDVVVKSNLKSGSLTLFVDGEEVYSAELSSTDSSGIGRVFKKAVGKATQNLESRIEIPAGQHTIEARVFNEAKERDLVEQLEVDLEEGQTHSLRVVTGGTFGRRLDLEID